MALPITGPFTKFVTTKGKIGVFNVDMVQVSRTWSRQAPPYNLPLPFGYSSVAITSFGGGSGDYVTVSTPPVFSYKEAQSTRLYAAAYERFMKRVKEDAAELGTTLVEWHKARDMITDRATKLWKGLRAARRGDVRTLKSLWGKDAGIRANLRRQGSNVLEYSFGWAPLVGDLATACAVLGGGIPPPFVKASQKLYYTGDSGWRDMGIVQRRETSKGFIQWSLRSWVRVTNPNLLLHQELGLSNPASVLWEITPWSFVVDYVVNVSAFLGSFTDLLGLELESPSRTFFASENGFGYGKWDTGSPPSYDPYHYTWNRTTVTRSLGVPGPSLVLRVPWRMSVNRAATSVSLLLQQLRK